MSELDILHWNMNTEVPFPWLASLPRLPKVVTLYDATIETVPECHHPEAIARWRAHHDRVRQLNSYWLTISRASQSDLVRTAGLDPARSAVVYPGHNFDGSPVPAEVPPVPTPSAQPNPQAILERLGISGRPFAMTVGTLEPRKNHVRLFRAWRAAMASPQFHDWRLVVVGRDGWLCQEILDTLRDTPQVIRAGRVSQEELAELYRGSQLCVYPSLYEGFGLPVAEAMSFGVPVLTSNCSSLPEVAGQAAKLIDPQNQEQLNLALRELLADKALRRELGERGRQQAQQFHWDTAARQTMAFFERVAREWSVPVSVLPSGVSAPAGPRV